MPQRGAVGDLSQHAGYGVRARLRPMRRVWGKLIPLQERDGRDLTGRICSRMFENGRDCSRMFESVRSVVGGLSQHADYGVRARLRPLRRVWGKPVPLQERDLTGHVDLFSTFRECSRMFESVRGAVGDLSRYACYGARARLPPLRRVLGDNPYTSRDWNIHLYHNRPAQKLEPGYDCDLCDASGVTPNTQVPTKPENPTPPTYPTGNPPAGSDTSRGWLFTKLEDLYREPSSEETLVTRCVHDGSWREGSNLLFTYVFDICRTNVCPYGVFNRRVLWIIHSGIVHEIWIIHLQVIHEIWIFHLRVIHEIFT